MSDDVKNMYEFTNDKKQKFAERLIELRKDYKKSQESIAKKIDVTQQTYANYESGKRLPSIDILYSLAKLYNVPSDYLIGITDSKENDKGIQAAVDLLGLSDKSVETLYFVNNSSSPENWGISMIDCLNILMENADFKLLLLLASQLKSNIEEFDNDVVSKLGDDINKKEICDTDKILNLKATSDEIAFHLYDYNKRVSRVINNTFAIMFEDVESLLSNEIFLNSKGKISKTEKKERIKNLNKIIIKMKEKNIWKNENIDIDTEISDDQ